MRQITKNQRVSTVVTVAIFVIVLGISILANKSSARVTWYKLVNKVEHTTSK